MTGAGPAVLSCGEALLDLMPVGHGGEAALRPVPGGAPLNVAVALARLGVPAGFLGRLPEGPEGDALAAVLRREGVADGAVRRVAEPPTLALVTPGADGRNRFHLYARGTAGLALAPADLPPRLDGVAAIHVGGVAAVVEPFASAVEELVRREGPRRVVSFDPNVRPEAIDDEEATRARLVRLLRASAIVKASDEDAAWLAPGRPPEESARDWAGDGGPELVILSLGPGGAAAWTARAHARVPAPPTAVVDTVGAGDTLCAGVLCWLWERGALRRDALGGLDDDALAACLGFGVAAAALACARRGADPPRRAALP